MCGPVRARPATSSSGPTGLALSDDGAQLFIADTGNHRVVVVATADWIVFQEIGGGPGSGPGQLDAPRDLEVWSGGAAPGTGGRLFVADTGNDRIVTYDFTSGAGIWQYSGAWGSTGSGPGQFNAPGGAAVDSQQAKVWVADTGNSRVQVYEQSGGAPLEVFGTAGSGAGQFSSPQDLAFMPSPLTLLVADTGNDRVQEWSVAAGSAPTVVYRRSFGKPGGTAIWRLHDPLAVAVDRRQASDMYVADTGNHRVQRWLRDTTGPRTYAYRKVTTRRVRTASLRYKVADKLSDQCLVEIRIFRRGVRKKTLAVGWRSPGSWRAATFRCTLAAGTYTWKVYAKDRAGNVQVSPVGSKTLVVQR